MVRDTFRGDPIQWFPGGTGTPETVMHIKIMGGFVSLHIFDDGVKSNEDEDKGGN